MAGLIYLVLSLGPETSGKHLARVDWLPPEATDVTFVKTDGFGWINCYECTIPRPPLERLAAAKGWVLESRTGVSNGFRAMLGLPKLKSTEHGASDLVSRALVYQQRQSNGGGITVIYDLDAGRLFVFESHR